MQQLFSTNGFPRWNRFGGPIDVTDTLMELRVQWATDLYTEAKLPLYINDLVAMVAWETAEGGGFGDIAAYNPLNTTQSYGNSFPINSVDVQSYASYADGLAATVLTLSYSYYVSIIDCLKQNVPAVDTAQAIGNSPWGTPGYLVSECIEVAQASVAQYYIPPTPPEVEVADYIIKDRNGLYYEQAVINSQTQWKGFQDKDAQKLIAAGVRVVLDGDGGLQNRFNTIPAAAK